VGSVNLFQNTLPTYGIRTTFVEAGEVAGFEKAITPNTRLLFVESFGNPHSNVVDFRGFFFFFFFI
jgi:O-acetylhomoserine (thiol)-lyase